MYFLLTIIVVLALAAKQILADSQSPFAQQPQHYTVIQADNQFPTDLKLQYPVPQSLNEIDGKKSNQAQAKEGNAAYDTDGYALSDPVQQYVTSYGAENPNAGAAAASGVVPIYSGLENTNAGPATGVVPIYSGFGNFGPYVYNNPGAFAVQSGYEGYLVPGPASQSLATVDAQDRVSNPFSAITNFFPSPRTLISTIGRAVGVMAGLLGVTVMGGSVASAFCTLTGLCNLPFPFRLVTSPIPWGDLLFKARHIDVESLARVANTLQTAAEKFDQMQDTAAQIDAEPTKTEE